MNMQQLECFTTLAKPLNYAKTAEQLSLSQPAVSRQIQSLETELNAKLFNRTTRSVSLTPVGFQFLDDAQQMLSLYYHSLEWISTFHKQKRTVLRIGYADSHANCLISKILTPLLSENANIVPVNDELDNIICATTSEAYNLALAGAGVALSPEHLILPHKELVFLPWEESPHAPMGIYYRQQAAIDKNSAIYKFICTAENYIAELSL